MENFQLLGDLALKLHNEFKSLFYLLLPIFFSVSLVIAWFKEPRGGPDFIESVKRAFIATLLLVGFQEITDTILLIANGLSDKISDMSGLHSLLKMAGDKAHTYSFSLNSAIFGANDLIIAILSFLSYLILYVARYIMVAIYHFGWVFLSILSPFILLFHFFSTKITLNLFKGMIEIASWQVVWAVLSAMLSALPFGNAYVADGNYLTVIVINLLIALCMLGTPLLVHSLVGNGFSGMASSLTPAAAAAMVTIHAKAPAALKSGREILGTTKAYAQNKIQGAQRAVAPLATYLNKMESAFRPSQAPPPSNTQPTKK